MSRSEAVDRRIYDAAMTLLRADGPSAVTVEAVAATSGVARTTIYRRHKDAEEVLDAALRAHLAGTVVEPGDDIWADMLAAVRSLMDTLETRIGSGVFVALITSGDPRQVELIRDKLLRPRIEAAVRRLELATSNGLIRADADLDIAVDLLLGSVAARFAHSGGFPDGWAESVVEMLRRALAS